MRHATKATLEQIEPLLRHLRGNARLIERTPGCFYRGSKAYVHFHEDPLGIFADVKLNGERFDRLRVSTREEQAHFLTSVDKSLRTPQGRH